MVESEIAALIAPWLTPTSLFVLLNIVLATIFLANNSSKKHDNNNNNNSSSSKSDSYQYGYHQSLQHQDSYEGAALVPPPPQLVRAPSLFSRVASFNFSNIYYSEVQTPTSDAAVTVTRAPSLLYRVTSFNFRRAPQQTAEDEGEKRNDEVEEARDVSLSHARAENQQEDHQAEVELEEKVVKVKKAKNKKVKKKVTEVKNEENTVVKKEEVSQVTEAKKVKREMVEAVKETASSKLAEQGVDSKADDFINKFKQQLKMQRLESLLRYQNRTAT